MLLVKQALNAMPKLDAEFLKAYSEHLHEHGSGSWKQLQDKFPAMPSATFWRRRSAADTFLSEARLATSNPPPQSHEASIGSPPQLLESAIELDPDDPSTMVERLLLMAQNLQNSSIVVVDGAPRIADPQRYATAARLIAKAAQLTLASWRT